MLKLTTDKQTDRQTDRQTNRQDENNMPPIIRSGGIKRLFPVQMYTPPTSTPSLVLRVQCINICYFLKYTEMYDKYTDSTMDIQIDYINL